MKICPNCQQTYSDDVEFCPRDGAPLPPDSLHRVILANAGIQTDAQLAGQLSRRFRIVRRLGAGAMGTVFLAEQIAVGNRPVALKVLNRKLLDDPEFLLRFQNEAASTGRIHHPNVVTIYESGKPMTARPTSPWSFWKVNLSARPSRAGARFACLRLRKFFSKRRGRVVVPFLIAVVLSTTPGSYLCVTWQGARCAPAPNASERIRTARTSVRATALRGRFEELLTCISPA